MGALKDIESVVDESIEVSNPVSIKLAINNNYINNNLVRFRTVGVDRARNYPRWKLYGLLKGAVTGTYRETPIDIERIYRRLETGLLAELLVNVASKDFADLGQVIYDGFMDHLFEDTVRLRKESNRAFELADSRQRTLRRERRRNKTTESIKRIMGKSELLDSLRELRDVWRSNGY